MKVLFIGNSHTFRNDMAAIFQKICQLNGRDTEVAMIAHGGKTFEFHNEQPEVRFNILYGNYDLIVLQDRQSGYNAEASMKGGLALNEFIKETDAKKLLYMTWTIPSERDQQDYVAEGYYALGKAIDAPVVPVGLAWWKYADQHPDEILFADDQRHATLRGSTLAAYTIYQQLYGCPEVLLDEKDKSMNDAIAEIIAENRNR